MFEVSQGLTAPLPMGTPFPSPLLSSLHHPFAISFLFILHLSLPYTVPPSLFFPLIPLMEGGMQKHTRAPLGLLALPKQGPLFGGKHTCECVSVNTDMMSCHLS